MSRSEHIGGYQTNEFDFDRKDVLRVRSDQLSTRGSHEREHRAIGPALASLLANTIQLPCFIGVVHGKTRHARKTIMKNWTLRTTGALCMATLALITGAALAGEYNTDKIGDVPRQAHHDLSLTCASRGLHETKSRNPSIRGIPGNSRAAINAMGNNNIECSNIDLRANDGVILLHDSDLGRTTNVGPASRAKNYAPYTGTGYNPTRSVYTYSQEKLKLRAVGVDLTTNSQEIAGLCVGIGLSA